MTLSQRFALRLRELRELRSLSQEQLAIAADLDRTYIGQLERCEKSPTLTTLERLATALSVRPSLLLSPVSSASAPHAPRDYLVRDLKELTLRRGNATIPFKPSALIDAINLTHDQIDEMYSVDLDIAQVLGMRNLSAFIGELYASAAAKCDEIQFVRNPHQDGYPDLLFMDSKGKALWRSLSTKLNDKSPFSPFATGGIEVKATCGAIRTPEWFRARNTERPALGQTRGEHLTGHDWKAHHRDTNNLVGLVWDFINTRPRIVAAFYSSSLTIDDWGKLVKPKEGGGKTTSVSIMASSGLAKMHAGWLAVLKEGPYRAYFNKRHGPPVI